MPRERSSRTKRNGGERTDRESRHNTSRCHPILTIPAVARMVWSARLDSGGERATHKPPGTIRVVAIRSCRAEQRPVPAPATICSHVGALLYCIIQIKEESCTSRQQVWGRNGNNRKNLVRMYIIIGRCNICYIVLSIFFYAQKLPLH